MTDYKPSTRKQAKLHRDFGSENIALWDLPDVANISLTRQLYDIAIDINSSYSKLFSECSSRDIVLERASCTIFADADATERASELLKSSTYGFKDRKPSAMIGLVRFGDIVDDISIEKNDVDDRKLLLLIVVEENHEYEVVWRPSAGGATAEVRVNANELPALLHDVYFDVLIANSFPIRKSFKKFAPDVTFQKKVSFCEEQSFKSFFGKSAEDAGYTSIVSCFRKSSSVTDVDWRDAMDAWQKFVEVFGEDLEVLPVEKLSYQMRRKHLKGGNISHSSLQKALKNLAPHRGYYLLMTEKKPRKEKHRHRVRTHLKKTNWRQNMWNIIPATEIAEYHWCLKNGYISAFKFVR